jgi:hypothetical protein
MTKLALILGSTYEQKRIEIRIRKFELGGHTFKVRVPLVSESDEIYSRIIEPPPEKIDAIYIAMTSSLNKFKDQASEEFQFTETDIIVSGRSMREAAKNKAMTEARITEYIRLLCAEDPTNSLAEINYEDIEAEWPLSVQLALVERIGEVISPTYKEARGN